MREHRDALAEAAACSCGSVCSGEPEAPACPSAPPGAADRVHNHAASKQCAEDCPSGHPSTWSVGDEHRFPPADRVRAEAWDEGARATDRWHNGGELLSELPENPYRAAAPTKEGGR